MAYALPSWPRRSRPWRALVLVIAGAMLAATCGGGDDDSGGEGGAVEVAIWPNRDSYVPPDEFQGFMATHPDIDVAYDVKDDDKQLQELLVMQNAGEELPDIVRDDVYRLQGYLQAGVLQPLDEVVAQWKEEDPDSYDNLLPGVWDNATVDGQIWGMASGANFDVIYYNVPWFEEAGVEVPLRTLEDVYDAAVKLKEARPDSVPMSVQALAGEGVTAFKALLSAAGTPFDGATPDLTSPQGLYVIEWYQRMHDAGLLPEEAISWGEGESRGAFIRGDAGMMVDGVNAFADIEEGGFDYGKGWATTLIPIDTGTGMVGTRRISSSAFWGITVDSEHPEEAGLLLRYLTDTDLMLTQLSQGSQVPRQTDVLDSPKINDLMPFFTDELKTAFEDSGPVPSALNAAEVEEVLEQLFGQIVTGADNSAEDLANIYQEQLDALD
jgi:ABC-type glycerol-3-phosphate transport system substrate-binding protein